MRTAEATRTTRETDIRADVTLDGTGTADVRTGGGFLDHMLDQVGRHGGMDLTLRASGDLDVDAHHTTEDAGLVLGTAVSRALGDRRGIRRYGHALIPMDETLARVVVDLSGRPYLVWRVAFPQDRLGGMDTELFREWFQAFAQTAGATLHAEVLYGTNAHHMAEGLYKALARALRDAVALDAAAGDAVPSTKGSLGEAGT